LKIMDTTQQDLALVQQLITRHFEIWNDPDPAHWPAKFPQVYTPDVIVADYDGIATGYADAARLIGKVQAGHRGFTFTPDAVSWNHGLGRVTWGYGPQQQAHLIRGEDIFTIRDGRLSSLRVFINKNDK